MKILAIDTTAVTAAAALTEDFAPIGVYTQNGTMTHSETMLNMVENTLKNAQATVDDVDLFAVSAGPGSFTGVRIGVSVIKGLAFGKNKPCVPVSTLEALAENLRPLTVTADSFYACPVMDARRNQLYQALFLFAHDVEGNVTMTRITEDCMIAAKDLEKELEALTLPVIFVGEGCRVTEREIHLPGAKEAPLPLRYQSALSVASAAKRIYDAAEDKSGFTDLLLKPSYLRPSQAEREKNGIQ
ncbi:MAG: tRNA (adenosine(37)-N6)-threonylcarbamoyltransferase complex dimerization subunit type 1 TsaB [Clostridia bacterium]|nr:tRNA (adenosine(37)-N6)-threonylcarbamoyltransferase complex dimerization subunit type 1 TsaB [Clostridia bacterium]